MTGAIARISWTHVCVCVGRTAVTWKNHIKTRPCIAVHGCKTTEQKRETQATGALSLSIEILNPNLE